METKAMHNQLYEDYRAISLEWEQALDDLADQLSALDDARRRLAEAEEPESDEEQPEEDEEEEEPEQRPSEERAELPTYDEDDIDIPAFLRRR